MLRNQKLGAVVVLAALAALAWLLWRQVLAPSLAAEPESHGETAPMDRDPATSRAIASPGQTGSKRVAATPAELRRARIFGRCIESPGGAPLAGCELDLTATARGATVAWDHPGRCVTGADGRFELQFDPPPRHVFRLVIRCAGRAPVWGGWSDLEPGAELDLGDTVLSPGTRVHGRVVDTSGAARRDQELHLLREGDVVKSGRLRVRADTATRTAADGSFVVPELLLAGSWSVRVGKSAVLRGPRSVAVQPTDTDLTLDVVVLAEDELDAIAGRVLDDGGEPVPDLTLAPDPPGPWALTTDRDGRFRYVRQEEQSRDPVRFAVDGEPGFEPMRDDRKFAWGTKDVVLRVRRALTVEVQALDATTGAPILEFRVRCYQDPAVGGGPKDPGDFFVRSDGRHEQGIARVAGVRRGTHVLLVEPRDRDAFAPAAPVRLAVTDAGAPRQVVRVPRVATRMLEVVRKDGAPMVGTRVEVLVSVDARPITLWTAALTSQELFQDPENRPEALRASTASTDAAGRCALRGPEGIPVCVRVLGPGHVPVIVPDLLLAGEPLRVVVGQGATLTGKVIPASLLARWAPSAADRARALRMEQHAELFLRRAGPGLTLTDPEDPQRVMPAERLDRLPLAAGGTFRIEGIAPGDWDVRLLPPVHAGEDQAQQGELLARVTGLAEGETRELVLDASLLVPADIHGLVVVDGAPHANAEVFLRGTRLEGSGDRRVLFAPVLRTDAAGRFTATVPPGDWTLTLGAPFHLPLATVVTARRGETTEAVFRFDRQRLAVRLVSTDGQPVADRDVEVQAGDLQRSERTDAEGRLVLDPALPGTMTFFVWPAHLSTPEQRSQAWEQIEKEKRRWDDLLAQRIALGEFTIPAGQKSAEVTLRLPR